jgi:predicted transcriptional regulator
MALDMDSRTGHAGFGERRRYMTDHMKPGFPSRDAVDLRRTLEKALAEGLADAEAGRVVPAEVAFSQLKARLGQSRR